ncbi:MAG: LppP/LprE family lipoprotein [Thermoleophilia bacterium]|nr:LppP/LprE family lipoprotein [Thermoleophilia bacterium]
MSSRNRKIVIVAFCALALAWIALIAFVLTRDSSDDDSTNTGETETASTVSTDNPAFTQDTSYATDTNTFQATTASTPKRGSFATMEAAIAYVQTQGEELVVNNPGTTWQPGATLHVLFATPADGVNYGGDYYFFFVDGYLAGQYNFTQAQTGQVVDATTFTVTFSVYLPGDSQCCPKGGASTVIFHWDGAELVTSGSLQGATM